MTIIPATSARRPTLRGSSVGPFSLITLIVVIVVGVAAFAAATYLEVFDDGGGEPRTTAANSFSRSAIGHRAFVAALRKLDIPVQISRFRSLDKAGPGSLLLMIEPEPGKMAHALLPKLHTVPYALLVLPKWAGWTDREKPIWIERMALLPKKVPEEVLDEVIADAQVIRSESALTQETQLGGRVKLDHPQSFTSGDVTPLIETKDGILLGAVSNGERSFWILSDPDLLSNAGIDEAENGVVAVSIIEALLPKGGTVIVDETLHGFEQRPNLMRTLLHPPFVTILIATVAALLVLVWGGTTRFGAPLPESDGLAAGKLTLVRSTAKLLRFGTSADSLLVGYRRLVLADVMNELHGPSGLDEIGQATWLDRAAEHRGLDIRLRPLLDQIAALSQSGRIDAHRALRCALDLYQWKQEIVHGTVNPARRRSGGRSAQRRPAAVSDGGAARRG